MPKNKHGGSTPWADPDDAPELDDAYFARADVYEGETLIRPARKPGQRGAQKAPTKQSFTLRVGRDVLAAFRATGAGWQTRMNVVLRAAVQPKTRAVRRTGSRSER